MIKAQEHSGEGPGHYQSFVNLCQQEFLAQKRQFFVWSPIVLALGIGLYFSVPTEVPLYLGGFAFIFTSTLALFLGRYRLALLVPALICFGFFSAQLRTHIVHTPILTKEHGPVEVVGTIAVIERMEEGAGSRLTLNDLDIEKLSAEETPIKIRLRTRKDEGYQVGQRIKVLGHLNVPSPPVIPGGFDFQRYMYFQQIGAVGFIYKPIEILQHGQASPFSNVVERLRDGIVGKIQNQMTDPESGLAMALMIGRRTAISEADAEAMRNSGLAHILAISGLHIGLFSGVLFFFFRLTMAAIPALALDYPIKKYAAALALVGAFIYMLLAGATVPTQRAFLMTSIVFLAIMLDRSPISLRLVSFAAFIVLLFFPESLLSASFHMSFAAVTALIVFYEWARPVWTSWRARKGVIPQIGLYLTGVCATTLVASLATAPFALFHFQKMAVYSLAANVLVMPLMAFFIMPFIVLAFLFLPLGLEFMPMSFMQWGLEHMLNIAHWVSSLPFSVFLQGAWPVSSLMFFVSAGLVLFLFKTSLRLLCVPMVAIGVVLIFYFYQYDIVISSRFKLVGVRTDNAQLLVSSLRKDRFTRENWLRRFGLREDDFTKWPKEGAVEGGTIICDEYACRWTQKGYKISYLKIAEIVQRECNENDIILSPEPLENCGAPYVIDFFDTYRKGSHGLILNDEHVRIETSAQSRGDRPWSKNNQRFKRWH